MYRDLRRESAERLVEMDFDGYAIGGLSVGEPRELTLEMIAEVLPLLPADKPRYVMGVGYPDEIEQYARMGVDMMDCVLPTRAARHGLLFTSEGRLNIKGKRYAEDQGPPDPACECMVCRRYSRAYLRHLMQSGEALSGTLNTIHNLAYYLGIMERVRQSLGGGEQVSELAMSALALSHLAQLIAPDMGDHEPPFFFIDCAAGCSSTARTVRMPGIPTTVLNRLASLKSPIAPPSSCFSAWTYSVSAVRPASVMR